ncbi:MAG TPA: hypothetical protein ENK44_02275 [Caldithrix abyssi]|uniref:Co-chaperone DjlA N-terminal domain-containing protein n=1 Tax=Caldithrix abyssi TaxID=187145 RepID=A0A7V4TYW7_CALAY|nr:hypothetical protein [Caldithrix abyssi]
MSLKLHHPGEAFVAITILIMHADGEASVKELNYILKNYSSQPLKILDGIDDSDKFNFFLETKNKIYKTFLKNPNTDDKRPFDKEETETIILAAKDVLRPDLRETAFLLAAELAHTDGLTENEKNILVRIREAFELNHELANTIMEVAAIKYRDADELAEKEMPSSSIELKDVAEALIALELAVVFADEDVNRIQQVNMFWNLTLLNIFKDKSPEYYYQVKYRILTMFNKHLDEPAAFTKQELADLFEACKRVMSPAVRELALWVAYELAYATGFNPQEQAFIEDLTNELNIDRELAEKIRTVVEIKFRS